MPTAPWLTYMVLDSALYKMGFFGGIYPIKISHAIHYNFNFIG